MSAGSSACWRLICNARSIQLTIYDPANPVCTVGSKGPLLSVDDAIHESLRLCAPVSETERVPLRLASGRILFEDIISNVDLPLFDNSAMDGYAVSLSDLTGDGPWLLPIIGRAPAGYSQQAEGLETNGAVRIFTGALVPSSFDAVVVQEDCRVLGDHVAITRRPVLGANIRRKGESLRVGDMACTSGVQLDPLTLALLSSQGIADVTVFRKLRVGLMATGAELSAPGRLAGPSHIYESNRIMLESLLSPYHWLELQDLGIVTDSLAALTAAFNEAAARCDVFITTGGVSAGEEDHVVAAFRAIGGSINVSRVAMRPGKPIKVGRTSDAFFAGLPGNPNAALSGLQHIVLPALKKMAGLVDLLPKWQSVTADFSYTKREGRTDFLPAKIIGRDGGGLPLVCMTAKPSSSDLLSITQADGVLILTPSITEIEPGSVLEFERFVWKS
jgi:molybdopterin molybdotransferase